MRDDDDGMLGNDGRDTVRRNIEDRVVALVNIERRKKGMGLLRADERLRQSARWHSADMARRGFFAHQGARGPSPTPTGSTVGAGSG